MLLPCREQDGEDLGGPKPYHDPDRSTPRVSEDDWEAPVRTASSSTSAATQIETRSKAQLRKEIREAQRKMQLAAKEMDFMTAAKYRDEIRAMQAALSDARGE